MSSCTVSVVREVCHVFMTGHTHLLNYLQTLFSSYFGVICPYPFNSHNIPDTKKKDNMCMKSFQGVRACKS